MKSSAKKKLKTDNEPIAPNKTGQKKKYVPPRFEVLTRDQAKALLSEKALPGEAATNQLLKAPSQAEPGGRNERRSIADGDKLRKIKGA